MTMHIRKSDERGHFDHGWLNTYHTFSFGQYYDPEHMGFRSLRVMNEDFVKPGTGFGKHPHDNMEIITYVLEGALEHKDSMGNGEVLRPGEFQRMSAGTGIQHSEFNPSHDEGVHLYQIWLLPDRTGHTPSYEQKAFPAEARRGNLQLVASPNAVDGSLAIHQDARVYLSTLRDGDAVDHEFATGRFGWVQALRGNVLVNGRLLTAGDGAAVDGEDSITLGTNSGGGELMLFDLA